MKNRILWAAIPLVIMATVFTAGCGEKSQELIVTPTPVEPDSVPTTVQLTRAEQEMVNSSNEFAFNLFRTAQDEVKSQILSPLSITYALGMLNNGATGDTQKQITNVLGFGDTGADSINLFCYKMLNIAAKLDPLTKVLIANTIYVNQPYELQAEFVAKARDFYNAEPETRDFNDGKTMDVINQWASDHTERMIEKVLDENSFNPRAVSYLLNAIYFKGSWANSFDKALTMQMPFAQAGDTKSQTTVDMMNKNDEFGYTENDSYQALRLPYGNGSYAMTVLLPKTEGNALPKVPTAQEWWQLTQNMMPHTVYVSMPRFKTDTDINLVPIMTKLGVLDAFDTAKADFRNFCNTDVYIDLMKQVARIKVDEEGTEAAAVTVIGVKDNAVAPDPEYVVFRADHPFLYVISEQSTGAVFFIGQYTGN
ncbi:MAG: serpin family protein [Bacteroidaceae bacterium]|nr:serpin family protein [Bacteroidaceae bacterium]